MMTRIPMVAEMTRPEIRVERNGLKMTVTTSESNFAGF
jgi:hypothetical protein